MVYPAIGLSPPASSRRTVAAGEWLLLDFGAQLDGYCADITRTVVVGGRASERQRDREVDDPPPGARIGRPRDQRAQDGAGRAGGG